jgi:hypothetical protein
MRSSNFQKMKKLVKADRLANDEVAEIARVGENTQAALTAEEVRVNSMASGQLPTSSDDSDACSNN